MATKSTKSTKSTKPARASAAAKKAGARKGASSSMLAVEELRPAVSDVIEVEYLPEARKFVPRTKIHVRKEIPVPPEGEFVADFNPTSPLALDMPQPLEMLMAEGLNGPGAPMAATDAVTLVRSVQLNSAADNNTASNVGEPSVASNEEVVFYTGNWYAAISLDGGQSFLFVDPARSFPDPPGMSFCCDQVVHYIRSIDTFVWLLQYTQNASGENIQRLAFARTADARAGRWRIFDITPQSVGQPGLFLDYPDLATGTNMLYVTMNGFRGGQWRATILVRIPLKGIRTGNITAQHTVSKTNFNFRVAQHSARRAFWAAHQDTSTLRVFSWDETAAQPSFRDVSVARWTQGPFTSVTPDNRNWMRRADNRLTGATRRAGELWFAWASNSGGANNRPNPFIQIARIRATDFSLIENINIWDATAATCFPALSTNSRNEVGVSYMIGGGGINGRFPTHVVGILTGTRREVTTFASTRGPADQKWGDYLTVRRHYPNARLFSATGYTLQGGTGAADATPNYALFGRSGDVVS